MRAADLKLLACPNTGEGLALDPPAGGGRVMEATLKTGDGRRCYEVRAGIARLLPDDPPEASRMQADHYDRIAGPYLHARATLQFTADLWESLDRTLLDAVGSTDGLAVAEICCDAAGLIGKSFPLAAHRVGVELSAGMLACAGDPEDVTLVCGDATSLPLGTGTFDVVVLHGGVHHVPDRARLCSEIHRMLRPGGRVAFLEPLDDFFLWRILRAVIYRLSPLLNAGVEMPLRRLETMRALADAGFSGATAHPCGYIAFALFGNTDVMTFMAAFAKLPGARAISRALIGLDGWLCRVPVVRWCALQAVFRAFKPEGMAERVSSKSQVGHINPPPAWREGRPTA